MITGASSGIGRATALQFARRGTRLVLAARRAEELGAVAGRCRELGSEALAVTTDVSDQQQVEALAQAAEQRFGRIDVWVNNAGVLQFGRLDETPPEAIARLMEVNVLGYFWGAQAAIARFRGQGNGILINVASALGVTAQPYASAYVASKFAVRGLSDALRQELLDTPDIHVCTVLPFAIDTPIYNRPANYLGRKVKPLALRYSATTVAGAILQLAEHPRRQVYAGKLGFLAAAQKRLLPGLTDRLIRPAVDASELTDQGQASTEGNLFAPIADGRGISGGWGATVPRAQTAALWGGVALGLAGAVLLARRRS